MKAVLTLALVAALATSGALAQTVAAPVSPVPAKLKSTGLAGEIGPVLAIGGAVAAIAVLVIIADDDNNDTTNGTRGGAR